MIFSLLRLKFLWNLREDLFFRTSARCVFGPWSQKGYPRKAGHWPWIFLCLLLWPRALYSCSISICCAIFP